MDEVAFDFGLAGECSDVAAANELELLRRLRFDLDILKGGEILFVFSRSVCVCAKAWQLLLRLGAGSAR